MNSVKIVKNPNGGTDKSSRGITARLNLVLSEIYRLRLKGIRGSYDMSIYKSFIGSSNGGRTRARQWQIG